MGFILIWGTQIFWKRFNSPTYAKKQTVDGSEILQHLGSKESL